MRKYGAYEITDSNVLNQLEDILIKDGKVNKDYIGKDATYILAQIGIACEKNIKVIIMETDKDHPFVQLELMMPVLPIVRVSDVDEAIRTAVEVEHGFRHTAVMHSKNVDHLTKFARAIQTTIFVKNGPSYAGIGVGGEGYTAFTIAGPTGRFNFCQNIYAQRRCVLVDGLFIR